MKKLLLFLLFSVSGSPLFGQITFERVYDTLACYNGVGIAPTYDNCYIITAFTHLNGNDFFVVKVDSIGNPIWIKTFGGPGGDGPSHITQLADSSYIVGGSMTYGNKDLYCLTRLSPQGDTIWIKNVNFGNGQSRSTNQNNFAVLNNSLIGSTGYYDDGLITRAFFTVHLTNGVLLNSKLYTLPNKEITGSTIDTTHDGGFIIAGNISDKNIPGSDNIYLIKTNAYGDTTWTKSIHISNNHTVRNVKQTIGGSFLVTGGYTNTSTSLPNIFLAKINKYGNTEWVKTFPKNIGVEEVAVSIIELSNKNILLTGTTSTASNSIESFLTLLDSTGMKMWSKNYPASYISNFSNSPDSGIILIGNGIRNNINGLLIIKLDSLFQGASTVEIAENTNPNWSIFPNPSSNSPKLYGKYFNKYPVDLNVYSLSGQSVFHTEIHNEQVDLPILSDGLYFLQIKAGDRIEVIKIVIHND